VANQAGPPTPSTPPPTRCFHVFCTASSHVLHSSSRPMPRARATSSIASTTQRPKPRPRLFSCVATNGTWRGAGRGGRGRAVRRFKVITGPAGSGTACPRVQLGAALGHSGGRPPPPPSGRPPGGAWRVARAPLPKTPQPRSPSRLKAPRARAPQSPPGPSPPTSKYPGPARMVAALSGRPFICRPGQGSSGAPSRASARGCGCEPLGAGQMLRSRGYSRMRRKPEKSWGVGVGVGWGGGIGMGMGMGGWGGGGCGVEVRGKGACTGRALCARGCSRVGQRPGKPWWERAGRAGASGGRAFGFALGRLTAGRDLRAPVCCRTGLIAPRAAKATQAGSRQDRRLALLLWTPLHE
jgi:hypothetical protein